MGYLKSLRKDWLKLSNNWATGTLKEAPYWREGMSPEEYEIERNYFNAHLGDFYKGIYVPLWKQKSA